MSKEVALVRRTALLLCWLGRLRLADRRRRGDIERLDDAQVGVRVG